VNDLSLSSVLLVAMSLGTSLGGQLALKIGATQYAPAGSGAGGFVVTLQQSARSPMVWLGLILYGLSAITWIVVLSRLELSLVYPLGAINYVLIVVLSRFVLGEAVPPMRWIAVSVICAGIVLLARSAR
jgi:multidrug transporter EmrE-like cation transporter